MTRLEDLVKRTDRKIVELTKQRNVSAQLTKKLSKIKLDYKEHGPPAQKAAVTAFKGKKD